jgi:2-dehydro-3-deoxygalactonokinase
MDNNFLLGCDWGTSSFRLRLYGIDRQIVIGEIDTSDGVAITHKAWEEANEKEPVSRERFFRRSLSRQTDELARKLSKDLSGIPVLISGMASSTIGMQVIPYAELPFSLDGSDAVTRLIGRDGEFPHDILLVSGVRSMNDVMRGEETQVLGLISLLERERKRPRKAIILIPGTHCKHIYIEEGAMVSFQTFMTGEMYSLLGHHSILRDSVDIVPFNHMNDQDIDAFRKGVRLSLGRGFLNALFSVRTNHLFDVLDKRQNSFYLSGLLIGSELQSLLDDEELPVILCSGSNLHDHYKLALDTLGLLDRTMILSNEMTEKATAAGQLLLRTKTMGG